MARRTTANTVTEPKTIPAVPAAGRGSIGWLAFPLVGGAGCELADMVETIAETDGWDEADEEEGT